jgi:L-2-hydroxyglutarate oxidase LhgO
VLELAMDIVDITIAGGGIIGLLLAKELKEKYPEKEVFIFEASSYLGDECTGRNSGVLHGGMYYETDSLKHQLCIEGNKLWKEYVSKFNFKINPCGKYIVASSQEENETLEAIYQKGMKNKVPDFRWATKDELVEVSEFANVTSALYSPFTAIIDVPAAVKSLDVYLTNLGVHLLKDARINTIESCNEGILINSEFISKQFFNCAGLGSIKLREKLGLKDLSERFVKGCYLKTNQKYYNASLIYPVPFKDQKGLGVHTVIDIEGNILFGPNAQIVGDIDYDITDESQDDLTNAINKTFKNIDTNKLEKAYSGVRSQAIYNFEIYKDFWIKTPKDLNIQGYFECCAIDSPGLTSAPAIAKYLAGKS